MEGNNRGFLPGFYPMGRNTFSHQAMGESGEKPNGVKMHEKNWEKTIISVAITTQTVLDVI